MFINCKHCNALVATDPATDLPPERCPRCAGMLRGPAGAAATAAPAQAAIPAAATPTISSLLLPPDESARLAMPAGPAAAPVAGEAPIADVVEAVLDAIATPAVAVTAPAEEAPVLPAPEPPVDLPAADGIDGSRAMADAGVDPASMPAPPPTPDDDTRDAADAATAPSFLPTRPRTPHATAPRRWLPHATVAALALLLGLQVLLADRAQLAADAQWRPLVVSLCNVLGCDVPAWREPAAFTLLTREVRPHPQAAGALRVDATFRNDARWPQNWPRLLLTLSDVEGRPVAARAFDPGEYLAEPAAGAMLDSGGTARIRIDLREPAAATVSYSFDFR